MQPIVNHVAWLKRFAIPSAVVLVASMAWGLMIGWMNVPWLPHIINSFWILLEFVVFALLLLWHHYAVRRVRSIVGSEATMLKTNPVSSR